MAYIVSYDRKKGIFSAKPCSIKSPASLLVVGLGNTLYSALDDLEQRLSEINEGAGSQQEQKTEKTAATTITKLSPASPFVIASISVAAVVATSLFIRKGLRKNDAGLGTRERPRPSALFSPK